MKKHFKLLSILPVLLTLCSCKNNKSYDYSRYYAKNNVGAWAYLFCWKEWFQWNSCIIGCGSSGIVLDEWVSELQNDLPCPIETMKEIIAENKKIAPNGAYLLCIVDKPAVNATSNFYITKNNYNEFMYLYNYLEIEPMDFIMDGNLHK